MMSVVGIFTGASATLSGTIAKSTGLCKLRSLDPTQLNHLDCVLIDVRSNAEAVLKQASHLNGLIPVIALADNNTCFDAAYPFGCQVQDHTTTAVDEDFLASLFIENLTDEFRQQAIERELDYRVEVDNSVLFTDAMLLARIVRNLVDNAIDNTEK